MDSEIDDVRMSVPLHRACWRLTQLGWRIVWHSARGRGPAGVVYRLGPAFVKTAQLLSTRRDELPAGWCERLGRLCDQVPAPPPADVERTLRRAYGDRLPFATLDRVPLASGSIATVHRGVLPDGRAVAVKIRRAGVARTLTTDLALATRFARAAGRLPGLRRVPVEEITGQVATTVLRQVDFDAERRSLAALRDDLRVLPYVRVPAPVDHLCTAETVVMELIEPLLPFRSAPLSAAGRRILVKRTLTAVYQMLFAGGIVHCDLHPGNLYVDGDERVVLLDAGFVVTLPERVRRAFALFFLNMALGRGGECADVVLDSARRVSPRCDRAAFRAALAALVTESARVPAAQFSLGRFAGRLFDLQRRHGVHAAPEFVFPLMALLVVEGMVNELDGGVDFQAVALPVLLRATMPAAA
jgi:ubiquinone biosynthesis protein